MKNNTVYENILERIIKGEKHIIEKHNRGSGKTTAIKKLIEAFSDSKSICLISSKDIIDSNYKKYNNVDKIFNSDLLVGNMYDIIIVDEKNDEIVNSIDRIKSHCDIFIMVYSE